MSQKFPVKNFKWIKDTLQLNEDFIKSYNEESYERYFLEVDVKYREKLHELPHDLPFLPEKIKLKESKSFLFLLVYIFTSKLNMLYKLYK